MKTVASLFFLIYVSVMCAASPALCLGDKEVVDCIIHANRLCGEGKPKKAIEAINEVVADAINGGDKSQTALLLFNRARALEQAGMFKQAVEDYSWCIKCNPDDAMPFYNRGLLYQKLGMFDQAKADYFTILKKEPHSIHAFNNLGLICDAKGEHDKALSYYGQALEADPNAVNVHFNRAITCLSLGLYNDARQDFADELARSPSSVASEYYYKAVDNFLAGHRDDSLEFIARLKAMKHIIPERFTDDLQKSAQKR